MYEILTIGILFHFFLYSFIFRHFSTFRQERQIFIFHLLFFVLLLTIDIFAWGMDLISGAVFFSLLSIAAIYSMTFLSFWSIVEGSYSVQILMEVKNHGAILENDLITKTKIIGHHKKENRLQHLVDLKLAKKIDQDTFTFSRLGKYIHNAFLAIKWLANMKKRG